MNNPKLSSEQQRLGILQAEQKYNQAGGVGAGAEYVDYIGNDYVNSNKEAEQIAAQMKPQEIANYYGYTYDGKDYKDNNNKTVILRPEQIQQVAYQTMLNNEAQMSYLNEAQGLGIIGSADDVLRKAATNAANIYQRNNASYQNMQNQGGPSNVQSQATGNQNWAAVDYNTSGGGFHEKIKYVDDNKDNLFVNGEVRPPYKAYEADKDTGSYGNFSMYMGSGFIAPPNMDNPDVAAKFGQSQRAKLGGAYTQMNKDLVDIKDNVDRIRSTYASATTQLKPAVMAEDGVTILEPARQYNDQELHTSYLNARKDAEFSFSQAIVPLNLDNSYESWMGKVIGNKTTPGLFKSMDLSMHGEEPASLETVAEKHFGGNTEKLREAIANGVSGGIIPEHPYLAGASAISITDPTDPNKSLIIAVKSEGKTASVFRTVSKMNNQIINGVAFSSGKMQNTNGEIINRYITTDMDPATGKISAYTLMTEGNYTKEQIDGFVFQWSDQGEVAYKKDDNNNLVIVRPMIGRKNKAYELQKAMNKTNQMWDSTAQAKTKLNK
tara:strand:+ start:4 stop:1653 length:1650 start_codon:yes stop_codon:yes gene_type:complete